MGCNFLDGSLEWENYVISVSSYAFYATRYVEHQSMIGSRK